MSDVEKPNDDTGPSETATATAPAKISRDGQPLVWAANAGEAFAFSHDHGGNSGRTNTMLPDPIKNRSKRNECCEEQSHHLHIHPKPQQQHPYQTPLRPDLRQRKVAHQNSMDSVSAQRLQNEFHDSLSSQRMPTNLAGNGATALHDTLGCYHSIQQSVPQHPADDEAVSKSTVSTLQSSYEEYLASSKLKSQAVRTLERHYQQLLIQTKRENRNAAFVKFIIGNCDNCTNMEELSEREAPVLFTLTSFPFRVHAANASAVELLGECPIGKSAFDIIVNKSPWAPTLMYYPSLLKLNSTDSGSGSSDDDGTYDVRCRVQHRPPSPQSGVVLRRCRLKVLPIERLQGGRSVGLIHFAVLLN